MNDGRTEKEDLLGGFPIEIETQICKLITFAKSLFWFKFRLEIHINHN